MAWVANTTPYKRGFTRELQDTSSSVLWGWYFLRRSKAGLPLWWQQGCWFAVIPQSWGEGIGIDQVKMLQILFFQRFISFSWMSVPQIVTSLLLISRVVKVFILIVFATLFFTFWRRYIDIHTLPFQKFTPTCSILYYALRNFRYLSFYCDQLLPHSLQYTFIQVLKLEDLSLNLHYATY